MKPAAAADSNTPAPADGTDAAWLSVTVAYAPSARQVVEVPLRLPAGATVRTAIAASGLPQRFAELAGDSGNGGSAGETGIWGRKAAAHTPLQDGDRVEIWRPLQVDPKTARRQRFGQQGARTAGLFSKRRPGAKPGY